MAYLVETFIAPGQDAARTAARPAHAAYLDANQAVILAGGAKLDDTGAVGDGTFYLLDVATRAEAEQFIANDPYATKGLIDRMTVTPMRLAFLDGKRRPQP